MPQVSAVGGLFTIPDPIFQKGAPQANFKGILNQSYFDSSQTPPTQYVFNGQTWGLVLESNAGASNGNTASGAAASALTLNTRAGAAVFTTVSIAGGADLVLTINNSAITSASTQVVYSLSGVTTGAALSIKSVVNSAGSSVVTITNGTGLTTSTSNITLTFIVLN